MAFPGTNPSRYVSRSGSLQPFSHVSTGFSRNACTGMPPLPTTKIRGGENASAKVASPGKSVGVRPLLTLMATATLPE